MHYIAELKPKAVKDLKSIQLKDRKKIVERIDLMEDNLSGDVKKLTNCTPEYRMRVQEVGEFYLKLKDHESSSTEY